jgi:hypothetical protein
MPQASFSSVSGSTREVDVAALASRIVFAADFRQCFS